MALTIPHTFATGGQRDASALDDVNTAIKNYINAREITTGVIGARPAASVAGRYYFATDVSGGTLYLDTGSAWLPLAAAVTGPRVLTYNITAAGTPANTNETELITYELPAGTLAVDGQAVRVTGYFRTAANSQTKQARLYFGATAVIESGAVALNSGSFLLRAVVVRTGAATQDSLAERFTNTGTFACSFLTPTETLSGAVTIKLTGQNGTAAANDLIAEGLLVEFLG